VVSLKVLVVEEEVGEEEEASLLPGTLCRPLVSSNVQRLPLLLSLLRRLRQLLLLSLPLLPPVRPPLCLLPRVCPPLVVPRGKVMGTNTVL